jgi:ectoine hydroxylase-related dioxygenase (phytanoyl-CoA dioxygenase family)
MATGQSVFDVTPASELSSAGVAIPDSVQVGDTAWRGPAVDRFEADGVVCLRGVLDSDHVDQLRRDADRSSESPGPLGYKIGAAGEPGFFYYDFQLHERLDAFRWLVFDSAVPDHAATLMRSNSVTLYYSNMFIKDAGSEASTPWHEDASYSRMHGLNVINFWLALDTIPTETTLMFKQGSHKRDEPIYTAYHFDPAADYEHQIITRDRAPMPPFEHLEARFPTIYWALEPGDAVVFTQRTLHAAPGNPLNRRRRSANLMLLGDDATYNAAHGESDPPFKDENLDEGAVPHSGNFLRLR